MLMSTPDSTGSARNWSRVVSIILWLIILAFDFYAHPLFADCIFLCGDKAGMDTLDRQGRQGFANAYLASRGENIYGLLGSAEIVNQSARMEETWAK